MGIEGSGWRTRGIVLLSAWCLAQSVPQKGNAATSLVVNRVLMVSATGTPVENCQGLLAALGGIGDASTDNRYLIRLEPGTYDCETTVQMKPWVDLEGSGREVTLLTGSSGFGTLLGSDHSEVRSLTIGQHSEVLAITYAVHNTTSARFTDLTIRAQGTTGHEQVIGMLNLEGANPVLSDVEIEIDGNGAEQAYGIANVEAAPRMANVRILVSSAVESIGIFNEKVDNMAPFEPLVIRDTVVDVSGGTSAIALYNSQIAFPPVEIAFSTLRARRPASVSADTTIVGVRNESSNLHIRNSTIDTSQEQTSAMTSTQSRPGTGGAFLRRYGIQTTLDELIMGSWEVEIDNSQILGPEATVVSTDTFTIRIRGSLLAGGDVDTSSGGSIVCAGVSDESAVFSPSTCP